MPRWTPDGEYVTFISFREGGSDLYRRRADHTGEAELLLDHERNLAQGFYSPDGEWLVLRTSGGSGVRGGRDILGFRPGVDSVPVPLVVTENDEQAPAVSPDGRWLAYLSDETGRNEVFIRPFPDTDRGKWQVSDGGANAPLWAHNGRELFFENTVTGELEVAEFTTTDDSFERGRVTTLFSVAPFYRSANGGSSYDIGLDDERFLLVRPVPGTASQEKWVLVQNFFEELKVRVPN